MWYVDLHNTDKKFNNKDCAIEYIKTYYIENYNCYNPTCVDLGDAVIFEHSTGIILHERVIARKSWS